MSKLPYEKVFVMGDSHAGYYYSITKYWVTGTVMYNVPKQPFIDAVNWAFDTKYIDRSELLIFNYGEIDARFHLYNKISESGKSEDTVINSLVDNYINTVLTLHDKVGFHSVVPPVAIEGIEKDVEYMRNSDAKQQNLQFNIKGPDKDRSRYVAKINTRLQQYCTDNNIPYIDVYNTIKDENGFLPRGCTGDLIHITGCIDLTKLLDSTPQLQQFRTIS